MAPSSQVGQHMSASNALRTNIQSMTGGGIGQESVRGRDARAMQSFAHPSAYEGRAQQQQSPTSQEHQKQTQQQQQQTPVQRAALHYQSRVGSTVFPITGW